MSEYYAEIRWIHLCAVVASIALFTLRGTLMIVDVPWRQNFALRTLPHAIDTALLASALALSSVVHQYPIVNAWLTVKIVALGIYIVLGSIALRHGRTRRLRITAFVAALMAVLFIVGVARLRDPAGWFALFA